MNAKLVTVRRDPINGRFANIPAWQVPNGPRILIRARGGFPPGAVKIDGGKLLDLQTGEIK